MRSLNELVVQTSLPFTLTSSMPWYFAIEWGQKKVMRTRTTEKHKRSPTLMNNTPTGENDRKGSEEEDKHGPGKCGRRRQRNEDGWDCSGDVNHLHHHPASGWCSTVYLWPMLAYHYSILAINILKNLWGYSWKSTESGQFSKICLGLCKFL